jgi:CDGSH-type Zn-finger protein
LIKDTVYFFVQAFTSSAEVETILYLNCIGIYLKFKMSFDLAKILNDPKLAELLKDPAVITAAVIVILVILVSFAGQKKVKKSMVNLKLKKEEAKVVDAVDCGEIENLAQFKDGKLVMCRCWRSEKFPYCDGSHTKHNAETGDNVGPLIIKK